jgi:HAE1 family hydrophobic/amphiphilic exporter-1
MPASLFPNIDFPIVTIQTTMAGADPKTVESRVTDKIEEIVSGIEGIDTIYSTSGDGLSIVTVKFLLSRNIHEAANDIRDKVSTLKLPIEAEKPIIAKVDTGSAPVISLFVASDKANMIDIMETVDKKIKPKLQRISGVGNINVIGYRDREIKIFPDIYLLNKYAISLSELSNIISKENVKVAGGRIIGDTKEFIVKTEADSKSIEELKNIKIKDNIKLSDIAKIEDTLKDARSYANISGKQGILIEIQKISGENTLEIVKKLKDILPKIQTSVTDKFQLTLINDTSGFIIASLKSVEFDLVYGAMLAVLVVFLFLRNIRATIISAISLPTSIIGTFALMNYMGYSLDKMTLIGLTLAIGVLIDDAIVVIENIYKKLENGIEPLEAAYEGVKEIAFAILAISAMLLAVFVPVAFMGGIVGKFFNSFALTVSFAVIISYIVALTLIPALSARSIDKRRE